MSEFTTFSISPGTVISVGDTNYVVCREVKSAHIPATSGMESYWALARICNCGLHAKYVLPNSYAWDKKLGTFTTVDGRLLYYCDGDTTITPDGYKNMDLKYLQYALTHDDAPSDWLTSIAQGRKTTLEMTDFAFVAIKYSPTPQLAALSLLSALGFEPNSEQALALSELLLLRLH